MKNMNLKNTKWTKLRLGGFLRFSKWSKMDVSDMLQLKEIINKLKNKIKYYNRAEIVKEERLIKVEMSEEIFINSSLCPNLIVWKIK